MKVKKICQQCGRELYPKIYFYNGRRQEYQPKKYCSHECYSNFIRGIRRKNYIRICPICKNIFNPTLNHIKRGAKYCSSRCYGKSILGIFRKNRGNFEKGIIPWNKNQSAETNECVKKIAEKRRGQARPDIKGKPVGNWLNEDYCSRVLAGQIFGRNAFHILSGIQKKYIQAKVLEFKIRRSLNV